jgi:hypothetical protein
MLPGVPIRVKVASELDRLGDVGVVNEKPFGKDTSMKVPTGIAEFAV